MLGRTVSWAQSLLMFSSGALRSAESSCFHDPASCCSLSKAQVTLHLRNCHSRPPHLSNSVSFLCILLPPSFAFLLAWSAHSLSPLPLSISQTLCWQSQGCSVVNYLCDLFPIFISTLSRLIWDEWWVDGERSREREERGHMHSLNTWCGWRESAASSEICHRQCRWSRLWPELLLLCKKEAHIFEAFIRTLTPRSQVDMNRVKCETPEIRTILEFWSLCEAFSLLKDHSNPLAGQRMSVLSVWPFWGFGAAQS